MEQKRPMQRYPLQNILNGVHQEEKIDELLEKLYAAPLEQLFETGFCGQLNPETELLKEIQIPEECADVLTLGEIVFVIDQYFQKPEKGCRPGCALLWITCLGRKYAGCQV